MSGSDEFRVRSGRVANRRRRAATFRCSVPWSATAFAVRANIVRSLPDSTINLALHCAPINGLPVSGIPVAVSCAPGNQRPVHALVDAARSAGVDAFPHYNGYPAVLVRLSTIDVGLIEDLLTDAWRCKAPKRLAAQLEDSR